MKIRKAVPAALSLVVAAGALAPAVAGPKPKPISEKYSVQGLPVPIPITGSEGFGANSCTAPELEGISTTTKTIETKGAGKLDVTLTGFAGDWDITVTDDKGRVLGIGAGTTTGDPSSLGTGLTEKAAIKVKKPTKINIHVCNFGGGPTAEAEYVFNYS